MLKAAAVGAMALAAGVISLARAETPVEVASLARGAEPAGPVVKEAHIARLKTTLNLTAEQRPLWAPVEAALRDIARQSRDEASAGGVVQRFSDRASSVAGNAMRLRRLAVAARPLIAALDDSQRRDALTLARHFGFERFVTAF
jgi:hypothetical protein